MPKEKQKNEIVYALADYKQLVLAYKTKYAELVKRLTIWKTSVVWLLLFSIMLCSIIIFELLYERRHFKEARAALSRNSQNIQSLSDKLHQTQMELLSAQESIRLKDIAIKELEQNASIASKKLLEKLLKDQ